MSSLRIAEFLLAGALLASDPLAQSGAPPWAEVRATLERHCIECHGGDRVKSGFRLATAATFALGGSRGQAFDPERPATSRILEVIRYTNPDLAMPPDGELPDDARAVLETWILAGAPWPEDETGTLADPDRFPAHATAHALKRARDHWAYRPLADATPPRVEDPAWAAHPVDAFVHRRVRSTGLMPAGEAPPEALLRRATFTLIGLPPTEEERRRFLAEVERDGFDSAWSRAIDRLLASPRFGEHQARHWLDLVRYGETNGYERDATKKNVWRYRDWVIRAFNGDKPYDRFVLEQIAGDELAAFAPDEVVHPDDPDPLLATGYFRLGVWDDEPADRKQARADELADIVDTTGQVLLAASVGCARCHDHKADPISQKDYFALTAIFNNVTGYGSQGMVRPVSDQPREGQITSAERDRRVAAIDAELEPLVTELRARSSRGESATLVADARSTPTTWRYEIGEVADGWTAPGYDDSGWKQGAAGFGTRGTPGARVGTEWSARRIALRTRFRLTEIPDGLVLSFHHDEDLTVWINGQQVYERGGYRHDYLEVQLPAEARDSLVVGSNVIAVSCRQTGGGQFVDVGLRSGWLDTAAAGRSRLAREAARWLEPADARRAEELLARRARTAALPVATGYPALLVAERGADARPQHVMLRGSAHALGDVVDPAVPSVLAADGDAFVAATPVIEDVKSTGRRLAFVRWLFDDGREFAARVWANRLWQSIFGRGLCRTPGDFGHLGEKPTHPGLLDHLAREAMARGWSTKAMYRYLLTSRTFRMASIGDPRGHAIDPRNHGYWRADPRRLTAEQYRDSVLAVSGTLHHELYGPSVFPPLAAEVLATASRPGQAWGKSSPRDANRRSVYVFVKRSLRVPLLHALDQPDPDLPCADRFPTNVPTQALMTLNGAFTATAADAFASRLAREHDTLDARLGAAISQALGRDPAPDEIARHREFVQRLQRDQQIDEPAALAVFCLGLFNLNEFLWID